MLAKTHSVSAPWTIVESHDRRYSTIKVFKTAIDMIEHKIAEVKQTQKSSRVKKKPTIQLQELSNSILDRCDLSLSLSREEYERALNKYQERIREIEHEIYARRLPVIMAFEGWDAAGKGGSIKRLVRRMDPRGYEVVTTAAPNEIELMHHYLWRFWKNIPKAGHVVIFDRSWYGRILVERVEGFCTEEEWKRAYSEINEMEEQWANFGAAIMKFWIHVSMDEQLKRFELRQKTKQKQWKINEEDWRNREKWDLYKAAADEMLYRTSTSYAPWTIIESNSKLYARIKTMETVIQTLEKHL
jgi:polyphosphate kinase 2 (PPK2 family)